MMMMTTIKTPTITMVGMSVGVIEPRNQTRDVPSVEPAGGTVLRPVPRSLPLAVPQLRE
jgi:hypothetical protein